MEAHHIAICEHNRTNKYCIRLIVVVTVRGASNGFVPQFFSSLKVWSPLLKEDVSIPCRGISAKGKTRPNGNSELCSGRAIWIALDVFSFAFAPGEAGSAGDTEMLNTQASVPFPRPEGIHERFFAVWNCCIVVPAVIAALVVEAPVGRGQRAAPLIWGSVALGSVSLDLYGISPPGPLDRNTRILKTSVGPPETFSKIDFLA